MSKCLHRWEPVAFLEGKPSVWLCLDCGKMTREAPREKQP